MPMLSVKGHIKITSNRVEVASYNLTTSKPFENQVFGPENLLRELQRFIPKRDKGKLYVLTVRDENGKIIRQVSSNV